MWLRAPALTGMLGCEAGCAVLAFVYLQLSGWPWTLRKLKWPRTTWFFQSWAQSKLLHLGSLSMEASLWGPFQSVVPVSS